MLVVFVFISSSDHFKSKLENTFTNSSLDFFHSNKLVVDVVRVDWVPMRVHIVDYIVDHIVHHFERKSYFDVHEIEKMHRLNK